MKKKLLLFMILATVTFSFVACAGSESSAEKENVDPEYASFLENVADKKWYYPIWGCNDYFYFSKDNKFDNMEECERNGNFYLLYSNWEYDTNNKIITIKGISTCEYDHADVSPEDCKDCAKLTQTMEFVSCDKDTLVLVIDGEEFTFTSTPAEVNENDYLNRHPNSSMTVSEIGVFHVYACEHAWIQADDSKNEISFFYNPEIEDRIFNYVTASGDPVEGFKKDMPFYHEPTTDEIIFYENEDVIKTVKFIEYFNKEKTLILEIDGEEIQFKMK